METQSSEVQCGLCTIGVSLNITEFHRVIIEVEPEDTGLSRCQTRGRYHIPLREVSPIKVESRLRQTWFQVRHKCKKNGEKLFSEFLLMWRKE